MTTRNSHRRIRTWHKIVLIVLIGLLAVGGCYAAKLAFESPSPPMAVNACLADHVAIYNDKSATGDTVLVGRCLTDGDEFARRTRGNWVHYWRLVRVELLAVEQGRWDQRLGTTTPGAAGPAGLGELRFVVEDAWPTPESGIMIDKAPWPYRPEYVYAFTLDTTVSPARIVSQERRSLVDPSRRAVMIQWPESKAERDEFSRRIHEAIQNAWPQPADDSGHFVMLYHEQTDTSWIIIALDSRRAEALAVDKKTLAVTSLHSTPLR